MARRLAAAVAVLALVGAVPAQAKAVKAKDALIKLADLPDGWSVGIPADKASHKCMDYTATIKPTSSSSAFATFETSSDSIAHAASVYPSEPAAKAAFKAVTAKFDTQCKTFAFTAKGRRVKASTGRMKLTPKTVPAEFIAWRTSFEIGTQTVSESLVAYRQGTTTAVISTLSPIWIDDEMFKDVVDTAIGRA